MIKLCVVDEANEYNRIRSWGDVKFLVEDREDNASYT